ncbi:MAG: alpha/beta fold hydrolase [Chloroflexi bacterium]|nr:alpha/beta fold hydrolase [Chloroflexota bacterium]
MYYEMSGAGEPLVLIHGLGSSTRDWEFQTPEFSKKLKVITFDVRGHGQSEKPPGPYSMALFAADTAALLRALGIASAHIIGVSMGGGVAIQFALDYPALVKSLVIVNSGPAVSADPAQTKREVESRVAVVKQMGMRAMGDVLAPRLFPKPEQAALRETFRARWAENDPRAYIDATLTMADWNVLARVGEIQCPTLVIAADQDYTPVAMKEAYIQRMPNAKLVVLADSHHAVPMEHPEEFNAAVIEFLDSVNS